MVENGGGVGVNKKISGKAGLGDEPKTTSTKKERREET